MPRLRDSRTGNVMVLLNIWAVLYSLASSSINSSLADRPCGVDNSSTPCDSSGSRARLSNKTNETSASWTRLDALAVEEQRFFRLAREAGDDPSCKSLKVEYDQVCFTPPPQEAFKETKAFCDAFVETCSETLKTNLFTHLTELDIDYTEYCKKSKERFEYVCPEPLRFKTYADQAVDFCMRYRERCPKARIPNEPVSFRKQDETHIYIREIAAHCKLYYRQARSFCLHVELWKYPKYAIPCWFYKVNCIDVYRKVIYG